MLKSALIYRITPDWNCPPLARLEDALQRNRFVACGATDSQSIGWIEPRRIEHGALIERIGAHLVLGLRIETRSVPASAVKLALEDRLDALEQQLGYRPRGLRRRELKEEIVLDLLPRAFGKTATVPLWIDLNSGRLVVGATSQARADDAVAALIDAFAATDSGFGAARLDTARSPSSAMSQWLVERDAPGGFALERECELEQPQIYADDGAEASRGGRSGKGRATVRYLRHDLEIDEIGRHIRDGKLAKKLALSWRDRVAFVLDEQLALRRIEFLDLAITAREADRVRAEDEGPDADFEGDVALATGELGPMLDDLIEALGGERLAPPATSLAGAAPRSTASRSRSDDTNAARVPARME